MTQSSRAAAARPPTSRDPSRKTPMEEQEDHGLSVAAWTAVTICIVAAAVMSIAVVFPNLWLFVGGVVLAVVGVIAGKVLSMAGYGAASRDTDTAPSVR